MNEASPLELVSATKWDRALFTTYALSLSFFEAVILDRLVRQRSAPPLVLADVEGVRSALAEYGARRVGRDYDIEPVQLTGGVFHAKVGLLSGGDDAHLLVGSGNLTFGGWGANLECVEYLHPSFAGDAFVDASEFYLGLAASNRLKHDVGDALEQVALLTERAGRAGARNPDLRLVHNLDRPILEQLVEVADRLGKPERLTVASPFWDGGQALTALARGLGLDEAFVHAHRAGVVESPKTLNWPRSAGVGVQAVEIVAVTEAAEKRRLHGKLFEVVCSNGRLVLAGSANASQAALGRGGNVEACVLRVQRGSRPSGWRLEPALPLPEPALKPEEADEEEATPLAVLRASLRGEAVQGRVLGHYPRGVSEVWQVSIEGETKLDEAEVTADGSFSFRSSRLEMEAWKTGRLVLRLTSGAQRAEGFVSFSDLQEVRRRAGPAASRLLAIIARADTPEDAAAVLSYFYENPQLLTRSFRRGGASGGSKKDALALVPELLKPAAEKGAEHASGPSGEASLVRAIDSVLAAMLGARPAPAGEDLGEEADDELEASTEAAARRRQKAEESAKRRQSAARTKARAVLDKLLDRARASNRADLNASGLFAVTQYVCARVGVDGDKAREYLSELTDFLLETPTPEQAELAAAAVLLCAMTERSQLGAASRARAKLLALGITLEGDPPTLSLVEGFRDVIAVDASVEKLWEDVLSATTPLEEVLAFKSALAGAGIGVELHILPKTPEWPLLQEALTSARARRRIKFVSRNARSCPCSSTVLPDSQLHRLRSIRIATAPCQDILLCEEA